MRSLNASAAANFWALLVTGVKGSSASSMGCGRNQSVELSVRGTVSCSAQQRGGDARNQLTAKSAFSEALQVNTNSNHCGQPRTRVQRPPTERPPQRRGTPACSRCFGRGNRRSTRFSCLSLSTVGTAQLASKQSADLSGRSEICHDSKYSEY